MDSPIVPETTQSSTNDVTQHVQPQSTNDQETQGRNPYEVLDDAHKFVSEMRVKWIPYKTIADAIKGELDLNLKEQTLRTWCMEGGECHKAIEYLRKQRAIERAKLLEQTEQELKESALDAIGIIHEGMVSGFVSKEQLAAAESILDRAGYPKQSKLEMAGKVEMTPNSEIANVMKEIAANLKK